MELSKEWNLTTATLTYTLENINKLPRKKIRDYSRDNAQAELPPSKRKDLGLAQIFLSNNQLTLSFRQACVTLNSITFYVVGANNP